MIPLRDTIPSRRTPYVLYAIILVNALVFFHELSLPQWELRRLFVQYGLVPARYSNPDIAGHFGLISQIVPFFSSMFLHGGWLHIIGNMWVLWIFGDNVEDWFGHVGFAVFYLGCGLVSAFMQLGFSWGSQIPTIGASGAIAGVMGAYFLLYPNARVLTILPIFFFFYFLEIPAYVFLGFWFLLQFLSGTMTVGQAAAGGIAFWAHVGGFVAGAAVVFLLGKGKPRSPKGKRPTLKSPWEKVDEYW